MSKLNNGHKRGGEEKELDLGSNRFFAPPITFSADAASQIKLN